MIEPMAKRKMPPNRHSQRKKDYDYCQPGYYHVTLCTQNRSHLFGLIVEGDMLLNDAGLMINKTWNDIADHYPGLELDEMHIMPNHLHGIIKVDGRVRWPKFTHKIKCQATDLPHNYRPWSLDAEN